MEPPPATPPPETAAKALSPLLAVCISFTVLNTVFVLARFFTVLFLRKSKTGLWWDDYWIIPSYLAVLGIIPIGLRSRAVYLNLALTGNEAIDPIEHQTLYPAMQTLLKLTYAMINCLMPVFFTTRLSLLALYLRIFSGHRVRLAIYVVSGLVGCSWISCQLVAIFICQPLKRWWNPIMPTGHCINANEFFRAVSYPTLILDAFLIVLPLPTVWALHASPLRKAALSFLFLTSILALIASAYRTYVVQTHNSAILSPASTNILMSCIIGETGMYLIVACLPALAPLFYALIPASIRRRSALQNHLHPGLSPTHSDFARLTDSSATAQAVAEADRAKRGQPAMELSEHAGTSVGAAAQVESGQGVLVHTEVMVTQEETIRDVIGI